MQSEPGRVWFVGLGKVAASALAHQSTAGKILRLFGVSDGRGAPAAAGRTTDVVSFKAARRDLMERIGSFLVGNDLDIVPANLLRALAVFSGSDLSLARKIEEKGIQRERISQEWLDDVSPVEPDGDGDRDRSQLERLSTTLGTSIDSFARTTRSARTAAADYSTELTEHAKRIDETHTTSQMVVSLAELTKAMLDRTRQVEENMKRSEREVATLRENLKKATRDAEVDHLTGLPNRRAFERLLEHHFREAQRETEPLCVAFCDIDHFKRVNDAHGHETGDRVLQKVAKELARVSNNKCHVARHGGEEFVLLFRGQSELEAQAELDAIRDRLGQRKFVNRLTEEPIGTITFSGGIADVFAYPDARAALRAADRALYHAKQNGRNRIELANPAN